MATIQFLGGAGTVTGSKFVLEAGGTRIMIDCGLFQGLKELRLRNWQPLPVSAASISRVVLTHAHIDHTGYLPRLVRDGFAGPVHATTATADLLKIMLPDSGRLQEEDADFARRKGFSKHHPPLPLYTEQDANAALKHLSPSKYGQTLQLSKTMSGRFVSAGHILGSGFAVIDIAEKGAAPIKVVFSGDLGRYDQPILNDPSTIEVADYLLVESTYGDRIHPQTDPKEELAAIIKRTVERGGKIIIPAFALGRTQLLIYYLRELEDEGRIPVLPVSVDSPMGVDVTRLYSRHHEDHDANMETVEKLPRNPLATNNFSLVHGRAGSKGLDSQKGAAIIVSASGMATGGRVLHHLASYLPDPASAVILVGYQAMGTRGRRLQDGEKEIKIHGEWVPVNAQVESISSLSAHADSGEILRWLKGFKRPPRATYIVHGESGSTQALKEKIVKELGWNAVIPTQTELVELA
ncbi:MAG TPA: MBL fold metallo-hydrolase [Blastocatellia bacterium]|nr:MBL fold metallo-hydrolase [Blastocatellia bacterium]